MSSNQPTQPPIRYDAIVVGSGISGGWAAKELTEKGLKVLMLERSLHDLLTLPKPLAHLHGPHRTGGRLRGEGVEKGEFVRKINLYKRRKNATFELSY